MDAADALNDIIVTPLTTNEITLATLPQVMVILSVLDYKFVAVPAAPSNKKVVVGVVPKNIPRVFIIAGINPDTAMVVLDATPLVFIAIYVELAVIELFGVVMASLI